MLEYFDLLKMLHLKGKIIAPAGKQAIKELINVQLAIKDANIFCTKHVRPLEKVMQYWLGELAWYLSCSPKAEDIAPYSKFWLKLADIDGNVNSNYGHAVFNKPVGGSMSTAFGWASEQLKRDPFSKRAIIIYNGLDCCYDGNKDFLCTQNQHFFIRGGELTSLVSMRSSDAIYGLTYDIPWWATLQKIMHFSLIGKYPNLKNGETYVNIGTSHIYENKWQLVKDMIDDEKELYRFELSENIPSAHQMQYYFDNLKYTINKIN